MKIRKRRAMSGFTLIELMIGFGMVIAASILVFAYAANTKVSASVHHESSAINMGVSRIRNMFPGRDYSAISNTVLANAKVFTASRVSGASVSNSWGGAIVVAPATLNGIANIAFSWSLNRVPQAECFDLVASVDPLFHEIQVNGVVVKTFPGSLDRTTLAGGTACGASDSNAVTLISL